MRRRDVITGIAGFILGVPLPARAQPRGPWRIGVLSGLARPPSIEKSWFAAFPAGLRKLGYIEDKDFVIEYRFAEGKYERYREFAAEFVRLRVDVIVVTGSAAIPVVQQATHTIPIVMAYSIDPVGNGLVASLAHPGGNTTGLASNQEDLVAKQLEFLMLFRPGLSRVGVLTNPASPNHPGMLKNVRRAAQKARIALAVAPARDAPELDAAFAAMGEEGAGALLALPDSFFNANRDRLAELAVQKQLPSMFAQRDYVAAGGLMSYGESFADFFERSARFVDKIFKGAVPGDIPVEEPNRFHLVINLKTANALRLPPPPTLLALADEVIE
jgi:putative tryptophan/tyrosine transport system substrate-binding protein